MIIGLAGYARSGKDTAAEALVAAGWKRVAFADTLREFLYRLNPLVTWLKEPGMFYPAVLVEDRRLQDVIDEYGWDGYKQTYWGDEIRQLLQRLGTECGRELISDTIWIDAALGKSEFDNVCITDCRFPNEAQAIKDRGGIVVRIERPGVGPANDHPSEHALADWTFDHVIHNDGSIEELHAKLHSRVGY